MSDNEELATNTNILTSHWLKRKRRHSELQDTYDGYSTPSRHIESVSSVWTEDEKDQLFQLIGHKQISIPEITRELGGTKSIRQVAEYLETLSMWSEMVGQVSDDDIDDEQPQDVEEVSDTEVEKEDKYAADDAASSDKQALKFDKEHKNELARKKSTIHSQQMLLKMGRFDTLIDNNTANLLGAIMSGNTETEVMVSTVECLREAVIELLESMFRKLIISSFIAARNTFKTEKLKQLRVNVSREQVLTIARMHGITDVVPISELWKRINAKYGID